MLGHPGRENCSFGNENASECPLMCKIYLHAGLVNLQRGTPLPDIPNDFLFLLRGKNGCHFRRKNAARVDG